MRNFIVMQRLTQNCIFDTLLTRSLRTKVFYNNNS